MLCVCRWLQVRCGTPPPRYCGSPPLSLFMRIKNYGAARKYTTRANFKVLSWRLFSIYARSRPLRSCRYAANGASYRLRCCPRTMVAPEIAHYVRTPFIPVSKIFLKSSTLRFYRQKEPQKACVFGFLQAFLTSIMRGCTRFSG